MKDEHISLTDRRKSQTVVFIGDRSKTRKLDKSQSTNLNNTSLVSGEACELDILGIGCIGRFIGTGKYL